MHKKGRTFRKSALTFNGLAVPLRGRARYDLGNSPVPVSDLHSTHRGLSSVVSCLDDVCPSTGDGIGCISSNNDGFSTDGGESINVSPELDFYNIVFRECSSGFGIRSESIVARKENMSRLWKHDSDDLR